MVLLLRGSSCRGRLLPDVDVDLTGISWWLACNWGRNGELLLSSNGSGSIGVFTLVVVRLFLHLVVVRPRRRPRSGDLGSRSLLPDSSGRLLYGRLGTQGGQETTLGSSDGSEPW
jgi:hypothetical protein